MGTVGMTVRAALLFRSYSHVAHAIGVLVDGVGGHEQEECQ